MKYKLFSLLLCVALLMPTLLVSAASATLDPALGNIEIKGKNAAGGITGWMTDGIVRRTLALNRAVTGGQVGRITAAKLNGSFKEGFGLAENYGFEQVDLNGEYAFLYTANDQMQGESLALSKITNQNTLSALGFSANNGWKAGVLAQLEGVSRQTKDTLPVHLTSNFTRTAVAAAVYEPGSSEDEYWDQVKREIKYGDGTTIKIKSDSLRHLPAAIMRELQGKNVTLEISRNRAKIYVYGGAVENIPVNKVFYSWDDLFAMYGGSGDTKPPKPTKPSSKPSSSSEPDTEISTLLPDDEDNEDDGDENKEDSSSSEKESSSSKEQSSEQASSQLEASNSKENSDKEDPNPEKPHPSKPKRPRRSIVPLVIAGVVILCAVVAGWLVIRISYRRSHEDDYDDDDCYEDGYEEEYEERYTHDDYPREYDDHYTRHR